ncbi:MAG TPA: type II toxin-antitoxin system prevent-host-death family antitoxin [Granulicella sp.]|jgi:prevent-host-death family protein|nr:type II toxin-antitoxin system prevent-host-death family antitoxin [Granulicella sp.]
MKTVDIHEAKAHLAQLVESAAQGESFVIADAGKPLVQVTAIEPQVTRLSAAKRIGFLEGQFKIPEDFDEMGREEIQRLFEGDL